MVSPAQRKSRGQLALDFARVEALPEPEETFEDALELTFPVAPLTEDYLWSEFIRLFGP